MKFTAEPIDLDLELVLLSGETIKISGPSKINTEQATKILIKIEEVDKAMALKPSPITVLKEVVKFLIDVYGKDEAFWNGNFEPPLLMSIRKWFINQLAGVKKKD